MGARRESGAAHAARLFAERARRGARGRVLQRVRLDCACRRRRWPTPVARRRRDRTRQRQSAQVARGCHVLRTQRGPEANQCASGGGGRGGLVGVGWGHVRARRRRECHSHRPRGGGHGASRLARRPHRSRRPKRGADAGASRRADEAVPCLPVHAGHRAHRRVLLRRAGLHAFRPLARARRVPPSSARQRPPSDRVRQESRQRVSPRSVRGPDD